MRAKTFEELETQYKRVLRIAFPKLRFAKWTWNWSAAYGGDPYDNKTFIRIHTAFISTAEKRGHPFFSNKNKNNKAL